MRLRSFLLTTTLSALPFGVLAQETTVLEPIVVKGAGGIVTTESASSSKTNTRLIELPQVVNVVAEDQISAQGANTVAQALRYTPGVHPEPNGYDIRYDWLSIRGFDTYGTAWVNGLILPGDPLNYATPSINPFALAQIDVIKGPSSVLYGRALPGGLVNQVMKRPEYTASREVGLRFSSFGGAQASLDFTGPVNDTLSYRIVGQVRNNHTQIDRERDKQLMLAPSLTWKPTGQTSLTVHGYYQRDKPVFSPRFYPALGTLIDNPAGNIPRNRFFGDPNLSEFNREMTMAGYELSHELAGDWTFRQNARYGKSTQNMLLVLVNPAFAYNAPGTVLNRASAISDDWVSSFTIDTQLEGRFDTGSLRHTLLIGLDHVRAKSSTNFGNSIAGVPPLDYLDPEYGMVDIPRPAVQRSALQDQEQTGLYVQDQVRHGNWVGTFGLRHDWSEISTDNRIAGTTVTNEDRQLTTRAGITYLAANGLAPYASWSTSFLPLLGTDAFGNPYEAQKAEQFELGVKYEPRGGRGMITASVFRMELDNSLTPFDAFTSVQSGKQRVQGLELEAKYEVTPRLSVAAGYAYSDSEVIESNDAVELGREILGLPRHQFSIWASYAATDELDLSAGLRAMSDYQTDTTYRDDLRIPGYGLVDLGASYDLGGWREDLRGAAVQVNVTNLFDKSYVSHCLNATGGSCNYGSEREISAALRYRW